MRWARPRGRWERERERERARHCEGERRGHGRGERRTLFWLSSLKKKLLRLPLVLSFESFTTCRSAMPGVARRSGAERAESDLRPDATPV